MTQIPKRGEPAAESRPRGRLRFSLRVAMFLVLVVGSALGWVVFRANEQRNAVAIIRRAGGKTDYRWRYSNAAAATEPTKSAGLDLVRKALGTDFVDPVVIAGLTGGSHDDMSLRAACRLRGLEALRVARTRVTDAGAEDLKNLTHLRSLVLAGNRITGRPLRHLAQMPELRELVLDMSASPTRPQNADLAFLEHLPKLERLTIVDADLTDDGLARLEGLKKLLNLSVSGCPMTTSGLEHLARLPQLAALTLAGSRITGLEPLCGLRQLRYLQIPDTPVGDRGLATLKCLRQLVLLDLRKTQVTDAGMEDLASVPALTYVRLDQTRITDAGLLRLAGSQSLRTVQVGATAVTDAGVAALRNRNHRIKVIK